MSAVDSPLSTATPPPPGRRASVLGWAALVALALVVTLFGMMIVSRMPSSHPAMDPEGHSGNGTMALAEILRAQGIEVEVVRTRDAVHRGLRADSTLVFAHPPALSDEATLAMVDAAEHTVIITASARLLRLLDLGDDAFSTTGPVASGCAWAPFSRVGEIVPTRLFTPSSAVLGCFTTPEGDAAVLVDQRHDRTVVLLHAPALLTNEHLAEDGNAALGLALLGQTGHVLWYVPSIADSDLEWAGSDTLGTLTPEWVTPAIVLLLLAGVAAAVWRARRFGPLVEETLPVTVRASETMLGRAHLTARAGDAAHAAEALRRGTLGRLARQLGLSHRSTAAEVADATADVLRVPRASLHELLLRQMPQNDAELITFARALGELEDAVPPRVHSERSTP